MSIQTVENIGHCDKMPIFILQYRNALSAVIDNVIKRPFFYWETITPVV